VLVLLGYWWFAKNQHQWFQFLWVKKPTLFLSGDFITGVKQPHRCTTWLIEETFLKSWANIGKWIGIMATWVAITASSASINCSSNAQKFCHLPWLLLNIPVQFWFIAAGWMSVNRATRSSALSLRHVLGCLVFNRLPQVSPPILPSTSNSADSWKSKVITNHTMCSLLLFFFAVR